MATRPHNIPSEDPGSPINVSERRRTRNFYWGIAPTSTTGGLRLWQNQKMTGPITASHLFNATQTQSIYVEGAGPQRATVLDYNFRDRLVATETGLTLNSSGSPVTSSSDPYPLITVSSLDNLGDVTATLTFNGGATSYRGREDRFYCGLPSLRTGRADLPHPALRLMYLLQGLTCELMGHG